MLRLSVKVLVKTCTPMSELLSSAAGAGARRGQGPGVRGRALGLRVSARPAEVSTAEGNWRHSEHSALCDQLRDIELLYVINRTEIRSYS